MGWTEDGVGQKMGGQKMGTEDGVRDRRWGQSTRDRRWGQKMGSGTEDGVSPRNLTRTEDGVSPRNLTK
jgi:hypothetical protein